MVLQNIDLDEEITINERDDEEQEKAKQMIQDLDVFSRSDIGEEVLNAWALNFIDDMISWNKDFTLAQIDKIDELHTKYLVEEDY